MSKIPKILGLSHLQYLKIKDRLRQQGDWDDTDSEWKSYILRLIMDDIGNI